MANNGPKRPRIAGQDDATDDAAIEELRDAEVVVYETEDTVPAFPTLEGLPQSSREQLTAFLEELRARTAAEEELADIGRLFFDLFSMRDLVGGGFGMVVASLQYAYAGAREAVTSSEGRAELRSVAKQLADDPLISVRDGDELVDRLADAGLQVVPPGFDEAMGKLASIRWFPDGDDE